MNPMELGSQPDRRQNQPLAGQDSLGQDDTEPGWSALEQNRCLKYSRNFSNCKEAGT